MRTGLLAPLSRPCRHIPAPVRLICHHPAQAYPAKPISPDPFERLLSSPSPRERVSSHAISHIRPESVRPSSRPAQDDNNSSASPHDGRSALHSSAGADPIFRHTLRSSEGFTSSASKHTSPPLVRPAARPRTAPTDPTFRRILSSPAPPFVVSAARCRRLPRLRVSRTLQPNGKEKGASESGKGLRVAARRAGGTETERRCESLSHHSREGTKRTNRRTDLRHDLDGRRRRYNKKGQTLRSDLEEAATYSPTR